MTNGETIGLVLACAAILFAIGAAETRSLGLLALAFLCIAGFFIMGL